MDDSAGPDSCWRNVNNYLSCAFGTEKDPYCAEEPPNGNNRYVDASAYLDFDSVADNGPIFILNAGGTPDIPNFDDPPEYDLSALQEALDLRVRLDEVLGFNEGTDYRLCVIDSSGHATGPLDNRSCREDPDVPGNPQGNQQNDGYEDIYSYESLADFLDCALAGTCGA